MFPVLLKRICRKTRPWNDGARLRLRGYPSRPAWDSKDNWRRDSKLKIAKCKLPWAGRSGLRVSTNILPGRAGGSGPRALLQTYCPAGADGESETHRAAGVRAARESKLRAKSERLTSILLSGSNAVLG